MINPAMRHEATRQIEHQKIQKIHDHLDMFDRSDAKPKRGRPSAIKRAMNKHRRAIDALPVADQMAVMVKAAQIDHSIAPYHPAKHRPLSWNALPDEVRHRYGKDAVTLALFDAYMSSIPQNDDSGPNQEASGDVDPTHAEQSGD